MYWSVSRKGLMIKRLDHLSYEERPQVLGLSSLGKALGDLVSVCKYLVGGIKEMEPGSYSVAL